MNALTFAGCTHTSTRTSTYTARRFWSEHGEASLNWLALGLLLAAWNASDNDAAKLCSPASAAHPATWGPSVPTIR